MKTYEFFVIKYDDHDIVDHVEMAIIDIDPVTKELVHEATIEFSFEDFDRMFKIDRNTLPILIC